MRFAASLLFVFASSFPFVLSQLCLPGPSGITHFNHLCNETFADANATGFYTVTPTAVQGVNGDVKPVTWGMTILEATNATEASIWYNTGGANYTNDISLGYDVCYLQLNGLTPLAQYNGQKDDGNCYSTLDEKCVSAITDLATSHAEILLDNPTIGPNSNLTGDVEGVCDQIGNAIKENFPSSCSDYFSTNPSVVNGLAIESALPLTDYNNTNPAGTCIDNKVDGCTVSGSQGTFWAAGGYYLNTQNSSVTNRQQTYDYAAQAVFPSLLIFMPVASIHRLDVPQSESHMTCLRVNHFNAGSRVPPPMASPPAETTHHSLSGGDIAGIVIGAVFGAALIAGLAFWLWRRRMRRNVKKIEVEDRTSTELEGGADRKELAGEDQLAEAGDATKRTELSQENEKKHELESSFTHELPGSEPQIQELGSDMRHDDEEKAEKSGL